MAAVYDPLVRKIDEAGLGDRRHALLAEASGRTVEIGAGTGRNLEHYPTGVSELLLTEPDRHMAKKLRRKVEKSGLDATVVEAPGERLPLEDTSVDTAIATLVLCTAPDPPAVVDEVARVLKPGGRFLFLEHVRAEDDERIARRQDRAAPITNYVFCGCHPNRRTLATIEASPLEIERVERGELPDKGTFEFTRPMIVGVARRPA
jgi:SAM-dependent methyltransferase